MSGVFSAAPGASVGEAAPGKVFRSELNPVDFLHRAAYIYPEKVAVVDGERRYSYRQLAERSWRLANALRSAGLGKGDRVATLLLNSSAMLEAHFAVPAAGGILVAVNHRLAGAEVGYILRHSGARYLLLDTVLEALPALPDLAGVTVIRCANTGGPGDPYEELLADASPARPASWLEHEEETISINYTSGTTGRPVSGPASKSQAPSQMMSRHASGRTRPPVVSLGRDTQTHAMLSLGPWRGGHSTYPCPDDTAQFSPPVLVAATAVG
jgi:acyl-coenzyme A synthetase/AMP-(fatty) acid ligase